MATNHRVEQRLTALEQAVAERRGKLSGEGRSDWIRQITGSITDSGAFEEALHYGREFRQAE